MRIAGIILVALGGRWAWLAFIDLMPENRFSDGAAGVWLAIGALIFIGAGLLCAMKNRLDRLDQREGVR